VLFITAVCVFITAVMQCVFYYCSKNFLLFFLTFFTFTKRLSCSCIFVHKANFLGVERARTESRKRYRRVLGFSLTTGVLNGARECAQLLREHPSSGV
jgi:hypothetical protein